MRCVLKYFFFFFTPISDGEQKWIIHERIDFRGPTTAFQRDRCALSGDCNRVCTSASLNVARPGRKASAIQRIYGTNLFGSFAKKRQSFRTVFYLFCATGKSERSSRIGQNRRFVKVKSTLLHRSTLRDVRNLLFVFVFCVCVCVCTILRLYGSRSYPRRTSGEMLAR